VAATLITNVSFFYGTCAPLFPGEVLVEEGRITGRGAASGSRRQARQSSMAAGVRCCPG
jgi:hypothetical protein